jgi:hypothetical protein
MYSPGAIDVSICRCSIVACPEGSQAAPQILLQHGPEAKVTLQVESMRRWSADRGRRTSAPVAAVTHADLSSEIMARQTRMFMGLPSVFRN